MGRDRGVRKTNTDILQEMEEKNIFKKKKEEKKLSEVGFEPTPTFVDQNARPRCASNRKVAYLESGALDHSAILTMSFTKL